LFGDVVDDRLRTLLEALEPHASTAGGTSELIGRVAHAVAGSEDDRVWLMVATLAADLPRRDAVVGVVRDIRLRGAETVVASHVRRARLRAALLPSAARRVRIVRHAVVVDVEHTARTRLATGIQRVVRMSLQQWTQDRELVLVGWTRELNALRVLTDRERRNAVHGGDADSTPPTRTDVVVPWKSTYILPELATEEERTLRILALAEFSGNATAAIGFDCVPLTSAETTGIGMGGAFGKNLAAIARFDRVAAISEAAAVEYGGWRRMLSGAALTGPDIRPILLPADAGGVDDDGVATARAALVIDDLPLLLCVGSHEPRKNHLAVITAAELLWREGHRFCLAFVGGNSWGSGTFQAELEQLKRRGRPITAISAISDDLLWGGYRVARATIFPSFNEGFGLPVAESLAVGTPVVTSGFGSMKEIADAGGAVLVNPRDDDDVARGIARAMFDDAENERLRGEAAGRKVRGWVEYADELWDFLVDSPSGQQP